MYTREQIVNMDLGHEMDYAVVNALGIKYEIDTETGDIIHITECDSNGEIGNVFTPSVDMNDAWEVQNKIQEIPKIGSYIHELSRLVGANRLHMRPIDVWKMVNASPENRCKAALLAVMDL